MRLLGVSVGFGVCAALLVWACGQEKYPPKGGGAFCGPGSQDAGQVVCPVLGCVCQDGTLVVGKGCAELYCQMDADGCPFLCDLFGGWTHQDAGIDEDAGLGKLCVDPGDCPNSMDPCNCGVDAGEGPRDEDGGYFPLPCIGNRCGGPGGLARCEVCNVPPDPPPGP